MVFMGCLSDPELCTLTSRFLSYEEAVLQPGCNRAECRGAPARRGAVPPARAGAVARFERSVLADSLTGSGGRPGKDNNFRSSPRLRSEPAGDDSRALQHKRVADFRHLDSKRPVGGGNF